MFIFYRRNVHKVVRCSSLSLQKQVLTFLIRLDFSQDTELEVFNRSIYLWMCIVVKMLSMCFVYTAGSSGFSFTAPSGAPSPFSVGAATPSSSATTSAGDSGSSVPDSKPFTNPLVPAESSLTTFQFGAASTSATSTSSQAVSSTSLAPSPFVFQAVNTTAPAKTTVASPFTFLANATGPSTTPAATFSFGSNAAGTAASATTATFQFAQQNAETAGALKPQPQASTGAGRLFQFAATNAAAAAVTTATTQLPSQTFGITSTPVSSSSEVVKPFAFNAGSTAQGFSFAPAQPSGTAGGLQSTFAFGAAAPKPGATFSGFAPAQPSSSQQTVSLLPLKRVLMAVKLLLRVAPSFLKGWGGGVDSLQTNVPAQQELLKKIRQGESHGEKIFEEVLSSIILNFLFLAQVYAHQKNHAT